MELRRSFLKAANVATRTFSLGTRTEAEFGISPNIDVLTTVHTRVDPGFAVVVGRNGVRGSQLRGRLVLLELDQLVGRVAIVHRGVIRPDGAVAPALTYGD